MTWEFTSPLTLLGEWRDRTDDADLHELLLLGFTVDLPFLEKTVIPTARALGARITVIGDAAQGLYDPVDVRMAGRSYFHGLAACRGSFHPKLALLMGAHEAVAAIGSGNPTMAGWGYNDELWTVLRGHDTDAPEPLRDLARWLSGLCGPVAAPRYAAELLEEIAARLAGFRTTPHPARVLHNLDTGLVSLLPTGPVDELHLSAPFVDQNGRALAALADRLRPSRITVGVQERWSSYDGDAILGALGGAALRLLPEERPRHGKLLEWRTGGQWTALTGSANLTSAALVESVAAGGNCELGTLAPIPAPLLPEGRDVPLERLRGRRTVRPIEGRPGLLVLGALLTGAGLLQVTLAHPYDKGVAVEVSPDGSPGSWTRIGTVPAGETAGEFAVPEFAGAVVRIVDPRIGGRSESPPVFVVHPAGCARRQADENRPRLRHGYTEEEIFSDEELGRRFRYDLLRLSDLLAAHRTASPARAPGAAATSAVHDRYASYLEECEQVIGRPLTLKLFGAAPGVAIGPRWGVSADTAIEDDDAEEPGGEADDPAMTPIPPDRKLEWRRWIARAVDRSVPSGREPTPIKLRLLIARLFVQLLGHGVWELGDETWRPALARLTRGLVPRPEDEVPDEAAEHVTAVIAVCMGLLREGASLTGGGTADLEAARTWQAVRERVARAAPGMARDLLIPPKLPHARVLSQAGYDGVRDLALSDDPVAPISAELAAADISLERDGRIHRVSGKFSNPIPVAARVATLLARHMETALVHAVSKDGGRWAFVAWRPPHLVIAAAPLWRGWRVYRVAFGTPESRLGGGEGPPQTGLIGRPVPFGGSPPKAALDLLSDAGIDHRDLLRRLLGDAT